MCENGFYNANCSGICGHCKNKQACDKESGNCFNGCSSNFQKPLCQGMYFTQLSLVNNRSVFVLLRYETSINVF